MVRDQLKELRQRLDAKNADEPQPDIAPQPPATAATTQPVVMTVTRRDILAGLLRPARPDHE
jgi:hypothetical protein